MQKAHLIIDIGTGNLRTCIVTESGEIIGCQTEDTPVYYDYSYPSASYFDPAELWNKLIFQSQALTAQLPHDTQIVSVTATSTREGIVLLDSRGNAVIGLPNGDCRGMEWLDEIPGHHEIYCESGHWMSTTFSATKLLGYRKHYPKEYADLSAITSISDWIGYMFTGRLCYEHSQACETLLYSTPKQKWSDELCRKFGISPKLLPPLISCGETLDTIKPEVAGITGLPSSAVYIVSGADTQMAMEGICLGSDEMAVVSGTTSPVVRILNQYYCDERERCWTSRYTRNNQFMLESNPGCTGINYQALKGILFSDVTYEQMEQEYRKKERILCYASLSSVDFSQRRNLNRGYFQFDAPFNTHFDRFDFGYAVMLDMAFAITKNILNQKALIPYNKTKIIGCGGGMQSKLLSELLASLTGLTVEIPENFRQASVYGCARTCSQALNLDPMPMKILRTCEPAPSASLNEQYEIWNSRRNKADI